MIRSYLNSGPSHYTKTTAHDELINYRVRQHVTLSQQFPGAWGSQRNVTEPHTHKNTDLRFLFNHRRHAPSTASSFCKRTSVNNNKNSNKNK